MPDSAGGGHRLTDRAGVAGNHQNGFCAIKAGAVRRSTYATTSTLSTSGRGIGQRRRADDDAAGTANGAERFFQRAGASGVLQLDMPGFVVANITEAARVQPLSARLRYRADVAYIATFPPISEPWPAPLFAARASAQC